MFRAQGYRKGPRGTSPLQMGLSSYGDGGDHTTDGAGLVRIYIIIWVGCRHARPKPVQVVTLPNRATSREVFCSRAKYKFTVYTYML